AQQMLQTTHAMFLTVSGALFGLPLSTRPHASRKAGASAVLGGSIDTRHVRYWYVADIGLCATHICF
ncbi:MAG: hypothetical protein WCE24_07350, partial [Pseudolabrys sp.]